VGRFSEPIFHSGSGTNQGDLRETADQVASAVGDTLSFRSIIKISSLGGYLPSSATPPLPTPREEKGDNDEAWEERVGASKRRVTAAELRFGSSAIEEVKRQMKEVEVGGGVRPIGSEGMTCQQRRSREGIS
jgi:hypothetical protein